MVIKKKNMFQGLPFWVALFCLIAIQSCSSNAHKFTDTKSKFVNLEIGSKPENLDSLLLKPFGKNRAIVKRRVDQIPIFEGNSTIKSAVCIDCDGKVTFVKIFEENLQNHQEPKLNKLISVIKKHYVFEPCDSTTNEVECGFIIHNYDINHPIPNRY